MILFAIVAVVMIALAIAAILPALLRRRARAAGGSADEDLRGVYRERLAELEAEHARGNLSDTDLAEARDELERELLEDTDRAAPAQPAAVDAGPARPLAIAVALLVPAIALAMYGLTGRPDLIAGAGSDRLPPDAAQRYAQMPPGQRIPELEAYVERSPEAPRAWRLLADAYRAQEQYGDAYSAYQRARTITEGEDASLIASQAEALLLANGRRFTSSVRRLVDEALDANPRAPLALLLAGHADQSEGRTEAAVAHWRALAESLPEGGPNQRAVQQLIARAQGQGGAATGTGQATAGAGGGSAGGDGARVMVRVRLADALRDGADAGTPVFVFARRAGSGGGPPLAVARTTVGALPAEIALTDAQAMMPSNSLSQAERVVITARVSGSGGVRRQPGDLEGTSEPLTVAANARTEVTIDQRVE